MKIIRDCFGRSVRLTDERSAHILRHKEMAGMEVAIERVLQLPAEVECLAPITLSIYFMSFMRRGWSVGNGAVPC